MEVKHQYSETSSLWQSSSRMSLSATRHMASAFSRSLALSEDREVIDTEVTRLMVKR